MEYPLRETLGAALIRDHLTVTAETLAVRYLTPDTRYWLLTNICGIVLYEGLDDYSALTKNLFELEPQDAGTCFALQYQLGYSTAIALFRAAMEFDGIIDQTRKGETKSIHNQALSQLARTYQNARADFDFIYPIFAQLGDNALMVAMGGDWMTLDPSSAEYAAAERLHSVQGRAAAVRHLNDIDIFAANMDGGA